MRNLKVSILAPLAIFIVTLVCGFSFGVYYWQEDRDTQLLQDAGKDLVSVFNHRIAGEIGKMGSTLDAISRNQELQKLFVARNRDKLLSVSLPIFQSLRDNYRITHFYFTGPDRVNFLRVHQPGRFGDTINRQTTLLAKRNNELQSALEVGPMGTFTLRVVIPWMAGERVVGFLELGAEIGHIISSVSDFMDMELHALVHKSNLNREDWITGTKMLGYAYNWDQLNNFVTTETGTIPSYLIDHVNGGGLEKGGIRNDILWEGRIISLLHTPIANDLSENKAILVAVYDVTSLKEKRENFIFWTIVGSSVIGISLFYLFWVILNGVEHRIRNDEENLRKAKEAAETSSLAKTHFLANMGHELRTPLNSILGFSEMMKLQVHGPLGSDKYLHYLDDIHFSGSHLLKIINDILHMSKIETGNHSLTIEPICVLECIDNCMTIVKEKALSSGISLVNDVTDDLPPLYADSLAIQQCIINLLTNAIKFTPRNGTVTIKASTTPRWFTLSVTDTGIGIAKKDLPRMTQPFTQIERMTTSRIHEGTGIGLTITRNLVEMHGGTLEINSELNVGTTVTIQLPRGQVSENAETPGVHAASEEAAPFSQLQ